MDDDCDGVFELSDDEIDNQQGQTITFCPDPVDKEQDIQISYVDDPQTEITLDEGNTFISQKSRNLLKLTISTNLNTF